MATAPQGRPRRAAHRRAQRRDPRGVRPVTTLKGMTWSHPRGYDPMVATAQRMWRRRPASPSSGTSARCRISSPSRSRNWRAPTTSSSSTIRMSARSPPKSCLAPLDVAGPRGRARGARRGLASASSYPSYTWHGRQWAFPIDAATQVQAYRPDLVDAAGTTGASVLDLARQGSVRAAAAAAAFADVLLHARRQSRPALRHRARATLIDAATGADAFEMLRRTGRRIVEPANFAMDPIAASEAMARAGSPRSR